MSNYWRQRRQYE